MDNVFGRRSPPVGAFVRFRRMAGRDLVSPFVMSFDFKGSDAKVCWAFAVEIDRVLFLS